VSIIVQINKACIINELLFQINNYR